MHSQGIIRDVKHPSYEVASPQGVAGSLCVFTLFTYSHEFSSLFMLVIEMIWSPSLILEKL